MALLHVKVGSVISTGNVPNGVSVRGWEGELGEHALWSETANRTSVLRLGEKDLSRRCAPCCVLRCVLAPTRGVTAAAVQPLHHPCGYARNGRPSARRLPVA